MDAGRKAFGITGNILSSLNSAHRWGVYDIIGGGGVFSSMAKHDHLDDAQHGVEQLQKALGRFKTELADVTIQANMQISIDGFLKFADYFFDGIIADWSVQNKIDNAISQVQGTQNQIGKVLAQLDCMQNLCEEKKTNMESELEKLVKKAVWEEDKMSKYYDKAVELRAIKDPHYNCAQAVVVPFAEDILNEKGKL